MVVRNLVSDALPICVGEGLLIGLSGRLPRGTSLVRQVLELVLVEGLLNALGAGGVGALVDRQCLV